MRTQLPSVWWEICQISQKPRAPHCWPRLITLAGMIELVSVSAGSDKAKTFGPRHHGAEYFIISTDWTSCRDQNSPDRRGIEEIMVKSLLQSTLVLTSLLSVKSQSGKSNSNNQRDDVSHPISHNMHFWGHKLFSFVVNKKHSTLCLSYKIK